MVKFKTYVEIRALNLICCCVVEASGDCVTCLWLPSDFSHGCDGQFSGAHPHIVLCPQNRRSPLGL